MATFAMIVGLLLVSALALGALAALGVLAYDTIQRRRKKPVHLDRLLEQVRMMGEALGPDFPIIEEVESYLTDRALGREVSLDELRVRLRAVNKGRKVEYVCVRCGERAAAGRATSAHPSSRRRGR